MRNAKELFKSAARKLTPILKSLFTQNPGILGFNPKSEFAQDLQHAIGELAANQHWEPALQAVERIQVRLLEQIVGYLRARKADLVADLDRLSAMVHQFPEWQHYAAGARKDAQPFINMMSNGGARKISLDNFSEYAGAYATAVTQVTDAANLIQGLKDKYGRQRLAKRARDEFLAEFGDDLKELSTGFGTFEPEGADTQEQQSAAA